MSDRDKEPYPTETKQEGVSRVAGLANGRAGNASGAGRANASYMLKQRAAFMRRDATQKLIMADKLDRLAESADSYSGETEEALWHIVVNQRD